MRWDATTASKCRYGYVVGSVLGAGDVIWERAEADYQGSANVLVAMPDGTFIHYEWSYGSCSGCDDWENRDLTDEQAAGEVRRAMCVLASRDSLERYIRPGADEDRLVPTANAHTNGGLTGMIRELGGGRGEEWREMCAAAAVWLQSVRR